MLLWFQRAALSSVPCGGRVDLAAPAVAVGGGGRHAGDCVVVSDWIDLGVSCEGSGGVACGGFVLGRAVGDA